LTPSTALVLDPPWQAGLRSARANLAPGLVLQAGALAMVLGYYYLPPVTRALGEITLLHDRLGLWFGVGTTALCGGLLPFLYLKTRAATRRRHTWTQGAALTGFWGYKGLEVGLWYLALARLAGEGHGASTIALKSALDQGLYCPVFAVPLTASVYEWIENGFHASFVWADWRQSGWYARRVLPMLLANFGVWLPAVAIIYALPTPLQLPLQNVVLCFFTLMLAHLAQRRARATPEEAVA
jgi:hypothetical protein